MRVRCSPFFQGPNSRIVELARACAELADEVGVGALGWSELSAALEDSGAVPLVGQTAPAVGSRDEYALAAGPAAVSMPRGVIAQGHASVAWGGVPPGIFDAAENTVDWRIEADGSEAVAVVQAAVIRQGPRTGVAVRLSAGSVSGTGVLESAGHATMQLFDATEAMTESAAWNHDWRGRRQRSVYASAKHAKRGSGSEDSRGHDCAIRRAMPS
jgi:hypothetical protein